MSRVNVDGEETYLQRHAMIAHGLVTMFTELRVSLSRDLAVLSFEQHVDLIFPDRAPRVLFFLVLRTDWHCSVLWLSRCHDID
jgi:hypothetical protein